jgi:plasmid stabilization system protein ParE
MDFKVIFRETFIEDLEKVVRSIAVHNPEAAHALGEIMITMAESLNFFPERNPRVRQRPGIRRFIVRRHFKVFYRVHHEAKTVEILRCWDGRRETEPHICD